jgi:hypothetical protein
MADEINWCPECAGVVYDPTCAICGGRGKLPAAARGEMPDGEGGEEQGEGQPTVPSLREASRGD